MGHVLVVDDEQRIRTMLCRLLARDGHTTVAVGDGAAALRRISEDAVDLVLLDLAMPLVPGLQVLERLRDQGSPVAVIVLSAAEDLAARVQALDLGAVDFVAKPFHAAELLARVRRTLASVNPAAGSRDEERDRRLEAGGIALDLEFRRAIVDSREVRLTSREFKLLAHLMRRRGHVCSREELLHDVWGMDFDPGTNVVDACVRRLRRKLGGPPIETIRSVGYSFTG